MSSFPHFTGHISPVRESPRLKARASSGGLQPQFVPPVLRVAPICIYGAYCPSSSLRFRGAPTADYCRIYVNGLVVDLRLVCRETGLPWGWFVPWLVCPMAGLWRLCCDRFIMQGVADKKSIFKKNLHQQAPNPGRNSSKTGFI